MKWPRWLGGREDRAGSYTDTVIAALVARAAGGAVLTSPEAIGAQEAAAGIWQRAFQAARVENSGPRTAALTPALLGSIGRELCRHGEALFVIDVDPDRGLALHPVGHWDVRGGVSRSSWFYRCDLHGPDVTLTRTLPAAGVVHVQYARDPGRPWDGLSPLQVASQTGRLAAALEAALADEATGPRGSLVTAPEATGAAGEDEADGTAPADPYGPLKADLLKLRGGLAIVESFAGGSGDRGNRPDRDWKPERLGADPPAALVELRQATSDAVLSACGCSPALFASGGTSTGLREALRLFYRVTVLPVARLVESELSEKLEAPVRLNFDTLGAADIATAARAYGALVGAQMPPADAKRLAGLS